MDFQFVQHLVTFENTLFLGSIQSLMFRALMFQWPTTSTVNTLFSDFQGRNTFQQKLKLQFVHHYQPKKTIIHCNHKIYLVLTLSNASMCYGAQTSNLSGQTVTLFSLLLKSESYFPDKCFQSWFLRMIHEGINLMSLFLWIDEKIPQKNFKRPIGEKKVDQQHIMAKQLWQYTI